jgi:tetratricopeptide (TPR) repeat protein
MSVGVEQRFEGHGRVTLTASTDLEYAFEVADATPSVSDLGASPPGSIFTRYLVQGLRSGQADLDDDGRISADELYGYLYARVRERSPHQTPGRSGAGYGDIIIATSGRRTSLPAELRQAIEHPLPGIREAAVGELARLRDASDTTLTPAIEDALRRALVDDSDRVRAAASIALGGRGEAQQPQPEMKPAPDSQTDIRPSRRSEPRTSRAVDASTPVTERAPTADEPMADGVLLERRGQYEAAKRAYRRDDERGDALAAHRLGRLLERHGDQAAAEQAYRRADERGDAQGALSLGQLLERRGNLATAEQAYRRADERGDAQGAYCLGRLLERRLDSVGFEAAYRRAADRGDLRARYEVELLEKRIRHDQEILGQPTQRGTAESPSQAPLGDRIRRLLG